MNLRQRGEAGLATSVPDCSAASSAGVSSGLATGTKAEEIVHHKIFGQVAGADGRAHLLRQRAEPFFAQLQPGVAARPERSSWAGTGKLLPWKFASRLPNSGDEIAASSSVDS